VAWRSGGRWGEQFTRPELTKSFKANQTALNMLSANLRCPATLYRITAYDPKYGCLSMAILIAKSSTNWTVVRLLSNMPRALVWALNRDLNA